jgi:hypothetical protein
MKLFLTGTLLLTGLVLTLWHNRSSEHEKTLQVSASISKIISSHKILSGDVVFRLGHGFISETLRSLSQKDQRYSHAGVISIENGTPYVYHLIGSESDSTTLRKESLDDFCKPTSAQSFAVYQILSKELQRSTIDSLNQYYYHCALPFDRRFDMETDSAMYCTEYVYKILFRASGGYFLVTSSELSGFRYIGCDDIYLNPKCEKIIEYTYKSN